MRSLRQTLTSRSEDATSAGRTPHRPAIRDRPLLHRQQHEHFATVRERLAVRGSRDRPSPDARREPRIGRRDAVSAQTASLSDPPWSCVAAGMQVWPRAESESRVCPQSDASRSCSTRSPQLLRVLLVRDCRSEDHLAKRCGALPPLGSLARGSPVWPEPRTLGLAS